MPKKQRKFADDGWAVWIDGEDTSTIHINDWLNPVPTMLRVHLKRFMKKAFSPLYPQSQVCLQWLQKAFS